MKEKIGIISEKLDDTHGIIIGDNQVEYFFSTSDFLEEIKIEIGKKVFFKEECYLTEKEPIYRAILISSYEEESI